MQSRLRAAVLVLFVANAVLAACDDSSGADSSGFELPKTSDISLDGASSNTNAIDATGTPATLDAATSADAADDGSTTSDASDSGSIFVHDAAAFDASLCDAAIALPAQQGQMLMRICAIAN